MPKYTETVYELRTIRLDSETTPGYAGPCGLHDGIRQLRDELAARAAAAPEGSWRAEALHEVVDLVRDLIDAEKDGHD